MKKGRKALSKMKKVTNKYAAQSNKWLLHPKQDAQNQDGSPEKNEKDKGKGKGGGCG